MNNFINHVNGNIRSPLISILLLFICSNVIAQSEHPLGNSFRTYATPGSTREWLTFNPDSIVHQNTFFTRFGAGLGLSSNDVMNVVKTSKDDLGFTHTRYNQFYKNRRVVFGEYILHTDADNKLKSANGRIIDSLNLSNTSTVNEPQALASALRFINAAKYLWQNVDMEKQLKAQLKDARATYFPKGELLYAPDKYDGKFMPSDYRLAWSFKIYTDQKNVPAKNVFIDALTGKVILSFDISMTCSGGTGSSAYNSTVNVNTEFSGLSFRSHNDCQATDIYVYNCNGGGASNTYYSDFDNDWGTTETNKSAVQAMWGAAQTYSYYNGEHGRQSWDGASGDMIAYNNAYAGSNNACWGCTGNSTIYYAGNTANANDDWNTNDIMGHEFTHGVVQSEAGLIYSYESGALNESFADIFGEMVESWSEGFNDYLVGGDRGAIRSFISPKTYGDPDTYGGTNWYTGAGDNGGVHTNSSVQNRWFYLLSEGGSGTNDNGESYNVTGITRFKGRLIAYRALTEYLTSGSQFIDARKASLQAAWDLYGQCSQEITSVGDAWHAVGVEKQSPAYTQYACGNYPANGTWVQAINTTYGGSGCTTTITPSASTVYFTSRDKVILQPGFIAQSGSNFVAYLEPCSVTRWLLPQQPIMSDAEKGFKNPLALKADTTRLQSATANKLVVQSIHVTPNPFKSAFVLTISAVKEGKAQVCIYNAVGVKVQQQSGVNLVKGDNKLTLDGSKLAQGVYVVEVNFGYTKLTQKIIKS